jgi:hypothetical protein
MNGKHRWGPRASALLVGAVAAAVAAFAGSAASAGFLAAKSPILANRLDPGNGLAAGKAVSLRQAMGGKAHRLTADDRATILKGLRRDPLSRAAIRVLGLDQALGHDDAAARILLELSDRISRRDAATQIWLIDDRAHHNDLAGTLSHYDAALSTSPSSSALLYPALTKALAYPQIDKELAPLIHQRRSWVDGFVIYATGNVTKAADLGRVLQAAAPLPPSEERGVILSQVLQRFAAQGDIAGGREFAVRLMGADGAALDSFTISNKTIAADLSPLTWTVPGSGTILTELSPKGRVEVLAPADAAGPVLIRAFVPRPGHYTLEQSIKYPEGGDPLALEWQAVCMKDEAGRVFWSQRVPALARNLRYRMELVIPTGCTGIRFELSVLETDRSGQTLMEIGDLQLKRHA